MLTKICWSFVDKYWRDECKWVQKISLEIFDENICSEDVQKIKIHYGNILVMYVTNVNWVGILLNSLFVYLKAFSGGIQMLVSIFSMESRWKYER